MGSWEWWLQHRPRLSSVAHVCMTWYTQRQAVLHKSQTRPCTEQVVWTGGARSILLWCAYTGAYLGALINKEVDPLPEPGDPGADIARIVEVRELQRIVDGVLAELTPEQRLLITLRDLQGLSYEEVAEITELSLVNVKSKLHRARLAFKSRFQPFLALVSPELDRELSTEHLKEGERS